jgi:hypothetical protein
MKVAPLLGLPSPPTLGGTDQPVRSTREGPATLNAITLDPRVFLAIRGSTLGVHTFPVPITPILRRRTMALPALRRNTEMHPPVARELLERKPLAAPRALLLRHGLNAGHCVPPFRVGVSFANSWKEVGEPHCLRRSSPPGGLSVGTTAPASSPANTSRRSTKLASSDAFRRKPSGGRVTARTGAITGGLRQGELPLRRRNHCPHQ